MTVWMRTLLGASVVAVAAASSPAGAVEAGLSPWAKGFAGFMSGFGPPEPGLYTSDIYYHFDGAANAEVRNGIAEFDVKIGVDVNFLAATYVTDIKILGGQYSFGGAIGWAWANLSADISALDRNFHVALDNNAFGDSIWNPATLAWHDGNLNWTLGLWIYAPTGFYQRGQLSLGKNIWAAMPEFAITYFDPKSGWDISGAFVYTTMSNNDATDYQSGDIVNLDWAIGKHFGAQWEAGIAGNVVNQITGDSGSGARLGSFREYSLGLGPSVSYSTKFGTTPVSFSAKWERDLDTTNTFRGDVVTLSASAVF